MINIEDEISKVKSDSKPFLSSIEEEKEWIELARKNSIPLGLDSGFADLDDHLRFKRESMLGIFGIDNVGKTTLYQLWASCLVKRHNLKGLMIVRENKCQSVRQDLIELNMGVPLHSSTQEEFNAAKDFVYDHIDLVHDGANLNQENLIDKLYDQFGNKKYDFVFIDPYNSIVYDSNPRNNYAFLDQLRSFQREVNTAIHISMHISTEKARNWTYGDSDSLQDFEGREFALKGQMRIPRKNFVEGGQPICNKLDDIIIVHRLYKMMELRRYTLISVDKIKETKTGGMPTFENPIMLERDSNFSRFVDRFGRNPLKSISTGIQPNNNFDDVPF